MSDIESLLLDPQNQYQFDASVWNTCNMQLPFNHSYYDEPLSLPAALELGNGIQQQNAFSQPQAEEQVQQLVETDSAGGGKRVNNTVFKTSLSQYRKSIIDVVKSRSFLWFLKGEIKAVYKCKNQSVFPKLVSLVRARKIQKEVLGRWILRKQKLIQKKKELRDAGKYDQKRLSELEKTIKMMDQSLKESNLQKSFDIYWGKYKQHQKYQKCKAQVKSYDVGLRSQSSQNMKVSLRSKKLETQRREKRDKVRKTKKIEKIDQV